MTVLRYACYALAAAALVFSAQAFANATLTSMKGEVRVGNAPAVATQRIFSGDTISTGIGAQAILKFDDEQQVVLNERTTFKITNFHYHPLVPSADRAFFDLLRGAVRFITGGVGSRNPGVLALRTAEATFSVRGTDFMVTMATPTYLMVLRGEVGVTTAGGTTWFGAGSAGAVVSGSARAVPASVSSLPATASGPFSSLAAAVPTGADETPAASSRAAGAASGAASGATPARTSGTGTLILIGIGAAVLGAAGSGSGSGATTHH